MLLLFLLQVFEDDWILSPAPDSGCPSEALLYEGGALDKSNLDLFAVSSHPKGKPAATKQVSIHLFSYQPVN